MTISQADKTSVIDFISNGWRHEAIKLLQTNYKLQYHLASDEVDHIIREYEESEAELDAEFEDDRGETGVWGMLD
jgi:hypothetical protein